jgi:hypothetical protein
VSYRYAEGWFDALGHEIGEIGIFEAIKQCVGWGISQPEANMCIQQIARYIRDDKPERAFKATEALVGKSNQTAVYMLLATLASHAIIQDSI